MEWTIRESSHGGFVAELAAKVKPGTECGYKPGFYMGGIVYESARFDTLKQAEQYIKRKSGE